MDAHITGHSDKHGRSIHVDDVLEFRLGKNLKHGGPTRYRVIAPSGNKFYLVGEHDTESDIGIRIEKANLLSAVVVDCKHIG